MTTDLSGPSSWPRLGVGTWAWGDRYTWGYNRAYGRADVEEAFRASLEAGITFFDTAEVYGWGTSERILGELGQKAGRPILIATKFAPFRLTSRALLRALDGSLARLRVESVDLYQIHFPPFFVRLEPLLKVLAEAALSGKAKAVGVSNFSADQMRRAHDVLDRRGVRLAANQVEYSLLHRAPEGDGVLRACRELGVTLIAYSPLAMGLLTGKYPPDGRRHPRPLSRPAAPARAPWPAGAPSGAGWPPRPYPDPEAAAGPVGLADQRPAVPGDRCHDVLRRL